MAQKQPPPEKPGDKAEANAAAVDASTPMGRFRALARGLVRVSREQLREEERRYEQGKRSKPRGEDT